MKIIDEKGRFFGKINVIDFVVILLLLCTLPAFYFGYKIMTKKPVVVTAVGVTAVGVTAEKEFIEAQIDCKLIKLKPKIAKIISVGDKELGANGEVVGEIVGLGQSVPYKYELDIGEGQKIVREDATLRQMEAKLKLKTEVKKNYLYYNDVLIKIGLPFNFKTNKYNLMVIPSEEKVSLGQRMVDLNVTLKDLDEDMLKKVSVGDKEVDESGGMIAEIMGIGKIEADSFDFNLGNGNFVRGKDISKKQISAQMRLKCQVRGGNQIYFKGEKISHNSLFEFKTDKYKVKGVVTDAFESKSKWLSLQVKFSGVVPEVANVVQKGDVEKDAYGEAVAMISSIITNDPSQVLTLKDDEYITLQHPFNKDILLFLEVQCIEREGIYYFKNYPVKMGNSITFFTDLYSISGLIVGMEIK